MFRRLFIKEPPQKAHVRGDWHVCGGIRGGSTSFEMSHAAGHAQAIYLLDLVTTELKVLATASAGEYRVTIWYLPYLVDDSLFALTCRAFRRRAVYADVGSPMNLAG